MSFHYSPKVVTNGLVLYLDAGNPTSYVSGSTNWKDLSRSMISGSLINGPTFSSANNGSIVFDGVDDYVNCGTQPFLNPTGGITLGCWVYFSNNNRREIFVGKGDGSGASSTQYWIEKTSGNNFLLLLSVVIGSTPTDSRLTLNDFIIQNNQWYYVCLTYDKQTYKGYVNGIQNSQTISMNFDIHTTSRNLGIGRLGDLNYLNLLGRISNTQIYNRALSASEVLQNYNATKTRFGL